MIKKTFAPASYFLRIYFFCVRCEPTIHCFSLEGVPNHGEKDGDIYDTGLKVVVPNVDSPLTIDLFDKSVEFLDLATFQKWMAKYGLTGS